MNIYLYIGVMALTTYLIRALPLLFLKRKIASSFLRSFLHYVPVACLTAMTFPAIAYATDHPASGLTGAAVAIVLALKKCSLIVVSIATCATVFVVEYILTHI
jgi:branched-subunit amino acid transport protein